MHKQECCHDNKIYNVSPFWVCVQNLISDWVKVHIAYHVAAWTLQAGCLMLTKSCRKGLTLTDFLPGRVSSQHRKLWRPQPQPRHHKQRKKQKTLTWQCRQRSHRWLYFQDSDLSYHLYLVDHEVQRVKFALDSINAVSTIWSRIVLRSIFALLNTEWSPQRGNVLFRSHQRDIDLHF